MKRTFAALLLIWFSSLAPLRAQSYIDGTANPTAEELTAIKTKIIPRAISVNTTTYVPVKIHLLRNSLGNGGVSLADLQKGFATLNSNFAKSGIQFYMTGNSVHYIDSNDYFEFQSSQETFLVRYDNESESNSAINLYCCELIDYVQGSPYIWARGRYPLDKSYNNRIFVKNDKVADGFAITQAFGHYFGLLSTFGQNRGVRTDETSDGTNCSTAGDLICDTPADPYRSVTDPSAADFSGCSYIGTALDNSGVLFKPVLNNFMSEYSTTCKDRFTTNQSTRMAQGLAERQTHLNYTYSSLPENIVAASNLTATLVDDYILVQWSDNAYNEQGYIIERSEISASAGFVAVQGGGVEANSTQFADKTVKANKDYYYRVRASNSNGNYSNVSSGIRMPLIYCKPTYTTDNCAAGQNLNIKRVAISETGSFSVLDNSSACSPNTGTLNNFSYYSSASTPAVSATLVAGTSYDFSVSTNEYIQHIAVWIDLDRDGSFSESELVFRTIGKQTDYTPRTFTGFKVPTDIKNGESRMRVRSSYGGLTNGEVLDPCASYTYGETEDYQVYLVGGVVDEVPPAFLSSSPSISNQSISGFDLNVSMNEVGKVYFIVVPNGSNATVTAEQVKSGFDAGWQPAMASGSFVVSEALTEFSRTISGLQAGTQYDVFVVGEDNSPTPNLMKLPVKIDAATVFPTAEFSADKKIIYQGQTVQFIDLSTGAGNKWSWNFGDGTLSQLQNPTHTYTTSGKFTIILSINNALSSITKTAYIQVLPKREVPYRLSDGGSFEVNLSDFGTSLIEGSMQLWQHGVPTGTLSELNSPIYGWKTVLAANVPNERNVSALLTPTFNFAADGQYILSFRKSMENAFFDGPYAVQVQYTLDNGASWARLGSYQDPKGTNWYNADPANGFSNTIVADKQGWLGTFANELSTYDASNLALNPNVAFRFVMYVASGFGVNSYVDGFMIDDFEVKYTPPTAEFSSDRVSLFPNESIQFADKSVGATSWYWDFGDGETATSQNPLHTYKIKGTYSVTLVINGKDIYTKRKSNYITVLPDPSVPYSADFEATDNGWKQYAITGDGTKKWEWGTSTAGFFATWGSIDGTKCWTTMLNENHGTNTRYALETPVFSLKKGRGFYYLEFAYRAYCAADPKTNLNKSGMKIEYRLDNGAWKVLGSSLQGQGDVRAIKDWYNTASIDGLGGEFGWYAATSSVFKPRFDITEFVNYGTVQFRFVFGASSLDAAGFQIDNFKIEGNEIAVAGLWVGGYSKNWHDRYNWDNDAVPDANTNVTIQSALYMPLISTDAECKTITVNPGIEITLEKSASLHVYSDMTMYANLQKMATFYNKGGALIVEGITTANKVIYNNIWDLVSLPTSNLAPTFSSATVRRYNEAVSGSWEYMTTQSKFKLLQGYSVNYPQNSANLVDTATITFTGALNNGEISYPLQKEDSKDGFNLVGNPYLSYIDWDEANTPGKWQKLKMYNNIWLYNDRKANYPETYAAYNGVVGVNGGSNLIKAGQGFYIMSKGTGSLTTTDAVRRSRTDLTNNASKPNNRVLYLEVKGSVYKDQIAIGFHDKALDLLDSLDCQKMMGSNPSIPNLYSIWGKTTDVITSKKKLAINFLSLDTLLKMDAYLEIPVGISIAEPANLSISASNLDVFDAKYYIFIRDNVYRNLTDLRNDDYQFTADGDADGRFTLLISDRDLTTATEQLPIGWSVYSSENKIYFASKNFTGGEYRVSLIDMAGRSIESRPYYNGSDYFELRTSGVYMIRITGPDILYSGKFFVKF